MVPCFLDVKFKDLSTTTCNDLLRKACLTSTYSMYLYPYKWNIVSIVPDRFGFVTLNIADSEFLTVDCFCTGKISVDTILHKI